MMALPLLEGTVQCGALNWILYVWKTIAKMPDTHSNGLPDCVRRLDGAQLLVDSIQICRRKSSVFGEEFRWELHPERTLDKSWRYAQDLLHDYYTGMGRALHSDFWCPKGTELLREVSECLREFVEDCGVLLGALPANGQTQGMRFAREGLTSDQCRTRLVAVGDRAMQLEKALNDYHKAANELLAEYQIELDGSQTRI